MLSDLFLAGWHETMNIVATVNLGCTLNLRQITLHARNAEYNPKRFAAVIMRIHEPKTTALFFSYGKMVCTGAKSEETSCRTQVRAHHPKAGLSCAI